VRIPVPSLIWSLQIAAGMSLASWFSWKDN